MSEIKIAHTADLHLGLKLSETGGKSALRKQELKNTFFKILEICSKEKVDLLLIAGDLFDGSHFPNSDLQDIKNFIEKSKFKVVISPGNHDPFTPKSAYASNWPENVYIFKNDFIEYFDFADLKTRVWGCAFKEAYQRKNLLENFKPVSKEIFNLCVMHGDLGSKESVYCPLKTEDIAKSGVDYLALGHIHKRSELQKAGNTHYGYCGCPEAGGFDEPGEKGIYIGTISKEHCNVKFLKTCARTYETIKVNVENAFSEREIVSHVLSRIQKSFEGCGTENFYKIILTGNVSEDAVIRPENLESALNEKLFYAKIIDNTEPEINAEKLRFRNDFKSIFIKKMIDKIEKSQNEDEFKINKNALKIGLRAFSEDVKYYGD